MLKTVNALNNLIGTILSLAIIAAIGTGGWFVYQTYFAEKLKAQRESEAQEAKIAGLSQNLLISKQQLAESAEQIDRLEVDLKAKELEIERLDTALKLLKIDHRVAQIDVLAQEGSGAGGDLVTKFSFVEVGERGESLEEPKLMSIEGDTVYVDSLVVKFTDEYIEQGDPLRSTNVCLFRRIFGETMKPSEGYTLDAVGSQPAAYRNGGKMSEFEQEIWSRFWEYANNPAEAEKAGVRAAHGEAPFQKLIVGKRYKVLLRSSGGLSFVPEDLPPEARPRPPTDTL